MVWIPGSQSEFQMPFSEGENGSLQNKAMTVMMNVLFVFFGACVCEITTYPCRCSRKKNKQPVYKYEFIHFILSKFMVGV